MNIVIFGPPGAGKGTQADRLASKYGLIHLSSGQLIRDEIASGSHLGLAIEKIVRTGDLVPDDLTNDIVKRRMDKDDGRGFIFDGFPRTIFQAESLNRWLEDTGQTLSATINLRVNNDELVKRLLDRKRKDDDEIIIRHRLDVYEKETKLLIDFYHNQGVLLEIDGIGEINTIYERIIKKLPQ
jgi:adenylate kinase